MGATKKDDVTSNEKAGFERDASTKNLKIIEAEKNKMDSTEDEGPWRGCCLTSIWPFTLYFGAVSFVTSIMTPYLTSQITVLEKQFGLSSSQSGLLVSMNDAGFLTSVLVASYLGRHAHIPRFLGVCGIIYGAAAISCIVPHFFAPELDLTNSDNISNSTRNVSSSDTSMLCSPERLKDSSLDASGCLKQDRQVTCAMYMAMLLISLGMCVQGMANSAKIPLAQIYIDDNVPTMKSGIHIGTIVSLSVFGPALSFVVGGLFSQIHVSLEETDITPRDPRWVGAWWLGFLGFGSLAVVLSIPLLFFPKRLADAPPRLEKSDSDSKPKKEKLIKRMMILLQGIACALLRLMNRPVYVCIVVGTGFRIFTAAGVIAFTPKYLQIHYGLSVYKSNILIGFAGVGGSAMGIFLSGMVVRLLKLDVRGMIRTLIITQIVASVIFTSGIFLECPQPQIKPFDINTGIQSHQALSSSLNASKSCFSGCNCDGAKFFPVCGADQVTYFSPCHAGCGTRTAKGFTDCQCIPSVNCTRTRSEPALPQDAVPGTCSDECQLFMIFVVLQCLGNFISGLGSVPATLALLRSVDDEDKALALGGSFFMSSLIGWFLGPIVMGAVIDTTCRLWNSSCSADGSCAVYDIADLRYKIHGVFGGVSLVYIALFIFAYLSLTWCTTGKFYVNEKKEIEIKAPMKK